MSDPIRRLVPGYTPPETLREGPTHIAVPDDQSVPAAKVTVTGVTGSPDDRDGVTGDPAAGRSESGTSGYPTAFTTPARKTEPEAEVKKSLSRLLAKNVIGVGYIIDYFTQRAIFESQRDRLQERHAGRLLLVCGGRIFVGDDLDELQERAQTEYPDRPFFSHSFRTEYVLL